MNTLILPIPRACRLLKYLTSVPGDRFMPARYAALEFTSLLFLLLTTFGIFLFLGDLPII